MEIEKTKVLLSNAEVLACIEAQRPPKKTKNSRPLGQFPFIQSHVRSYLRTTPALHEKEENISTFLNELSEYEKQNDIQFTKVEKMQLLNIAPKVPVDVYLIIEECAERLKEEQVDELIELVKRTLY